MRMQCNITPLHAYLKEFLCPIVIFFLKLKLLRRANKMFLQDGSKVDQIYFAPLLLGQIMLHCNKNCNVPVSPTLLQTNILRQEHFYSSRNYLFDLKKKTDYGETTIFLDVHAMEQFYTEKNSKWH